jgi:hypothetical protein
MYGACTSCPGAETQEALLHNDPDDTTIKCKHWVMTDRATLMTVTQQSDKLIENLVSKMPDLTRHHYTAKQQARYLKESYKNLQSHQCIILADFSENYSFILQDSTGGFHWANIQAIFYPFIVHIKDQHLQTLSFCVISDCLDQNTLSLHAFQSTTQQITNQHRFTSITNNYNLFISFM